MYVLALDFCPKIPLTVMAMVVTIMMSGRPIV